MGCINSNLSRQASPQRNDPFEVSRQSARPYSPEAEMGPGDKLVYNSLCSVLKKTKKLTEEIELRPNELGDRIDTIQQKANTLLKRIQKKIDGDMMVGSGADDYRQILSQLRSELDIQIMAASESARPNSPVSIYETGSSSTSYHPS